MNRCVKCRKELESYMIRPDGLCSSCFLDKKINEYTKPKSETTDNRNKSRENTSYEQKRDEEIKNKDLNSVQHNVNKKVTTTTTNHTDIAVEQIKPEFKECPYCAEDIKFNAIVCRYCGKDISPENLSNTKIKSNNEIKTVEVIEKGFWGKLSSGDFGLAGTFWVYAILVDIVAYFIFIFLNSLGSIVTFGIVYTAYEIPVLIGIWKAANKYQGPKIWAVFAKIATILRWIGIGVLIGSVVVLGL